MLEPLVLPIKLMFLTFLCLSNFTFSVDRHTKIKMDKEICNFLFLLSLNTKYTSNKYISMYILIVEKEFLFCEITMKKFDKKTSKMLIVS